MSTRSFIGVMQKDGNVRSIYCHWDGYVAHNGRILLASYSDMAKLNTLMDQGNCSSLGRDIGEKHPFDSRDEKDAEKYGDMCKFYGRDRGESGQEALNHTNEADFWRECDEEFVYLFKDGKWLVSDHGKRPVELTEKMVAKEVAAMEARYADMMNRHAATA